MSFYAYSKILKNRKGSASFAFFVVVLSVALVAFSIFVLTLPKNPPPADQENPKAAPQDAELGKLQNEIFRLYDALDEAEGRRNRGKYLEILNVAEKKLMKSDALWEEKTKPKKGAFDGL